MGKIIVDSFDNDGGKVDVNYSDQDPDVVVQLALSGDNDALDYLLSQYEAENPAPVSHEMKSALGKSTKRWKPVDRTAQMHEGIDRRWKGGYPQGLVDWYNNGADGQINWGEDGDFEDCVAIASKYIDNAEGFCNLRHQDATGAPPGHAPGEKEDKSLAERFAETRAVASKPHRSAAVADKYAPQLVAAYKSGNASQIASVLKSIYGASYVAGMQSAAAGPSGAAITDAVQSDPIMSDLFDSDGEDDAMMSDIQDSDGSDDGKWAKVAGLATLLAGAALSANNIVGYMNQDGTPDIEDQATQMAVTEAANGSEVGAQDAAQAAGFTQMRAVPDDAACDECVDHADSPYDIGDDGPPWHPRCFCESTPAESRGALGRHVRRWHKRDWAEWDLEHPYIPEGKHVDAGATTQQEVEDQVAKNYPFSHTEPVDFLQGTEKGYADKTGIAASGDVKDFQSIVADPTRGPEIGKAYSALPEDDPAAHPAYAALADEIGKQYDYMTKDLGIKVDVTATDPYASVKELADDLRNNHHISVLSTAATGSHPYFTNDQNDQFRAVHDVFGHAMTGRGFDRNGEEAAWTAHSQMFSPLARQAMTSETRGQNSAMVWGDGQFQPQKVALLPQEYVERALKFLAELRQHPQGRLLLAEDAKAKNAAEQAVHDADNLYSIGHTHHASLGRHFPKDYIAPEDRAVSAEDIERIEQHVLRGTLWWEERDWTKRGCDLICPECGNQNMGAIGDDFFVCQDCGHRMEWEAPTSIERGESD